VASWSSSFRPWGKLAHLVEQAFLLFRREISLIRQELIENQVHPLALVSDDLILDVSHRFAI
jgi:hypothetical protein